MIDYLSNNWSQILAIAAQVATVIAAIGIFIAYWEYRHSVKTAIKAERRSAVELAARQCDYFGDKITKEWAALHNLFKEKRCEYLDKCKVVKTATNLTLDSSSVTPADQEILQGLLKDVRVLLNQVESFAIPFNSEVAEDDIGFIECGPAFVDFFELHFPLYCTSNLQLYYQSTQRLYWRWRKRIDQKTLIEKREAAAKDFVILSHEISMGMSRSWIERLVFSALMRIVARNSRRKH